MSSFKKITRHPITGLLKMATYMDDYFGNHRYGIKFDGEDKVYTDAEVARKDSDETKAE